MKITDGTATSIDYQLNHRRKKTTTPVAGVRRSMKGENGIASANQFLLNKFDEKGDDDPLMEMECRGFERFNGEPKMGVSARKLAAGLWHLAADFDSAGGVCSGMRRQRGSIHPVGFHFSMCN